MKIAVVVLVLSLATMGVKSRIEAGEIVQTCFEGFKGVIPNSSCYKRNAGASVSPTCASNTFSRGLMCVSNCIKGYSYFAFVCRKDCAPGYKSNGLTCTKGRFNFYFKTSYRPGSYTHYHYKATCREGYFKRGAACYKDCKNIGYQNCGIGVCGLTSQACGRTVATKVANAAVEVLQRITFVASAEASTTNPLSALKSKFAKQGLEINLRGVSQYLMKVGANNIFEKMTDHATKRLGSTVSPSLVANVCKEVGQQSLAKIFKATEPEFDWEVFNIVDIAGAAGECEDAQDMNAKSNCANTLFGSAKFVNPAGLAAIVSTIIQDTCYVPSYNLA